MTSNVHRSPTRSKAPAIGQRDRNAGRFVEAGFPFRTLASLVDILHFASDTAAPTTSFSSIFYFRMIGSMFMRVNLRCAHQLRPPPGYGRAVGGLGYGPLEAKVLTGEGAAGARSDFYPMKARNDAARASRTPRKTATRSASLP